MPETNPYHSPEEAAAGPKHGGLPRIAFHAFLFAAMLVTALRPFPNQLGVLYGDWGRLIFFGLLVSAGALRYQNIGLSAWSGLLLLIPGVNLAILYLLCVRQTGWATTRKLDAAGGWLALLLIPEVLTWMAICELAEYVLTPV